jgi:hypothetical protein
MKITSLVCSFQYSIKLILSYANVFVNKIVLRKPGQVFHMKIFGLVEENLIQALIHSKFFLLGIIFYYCIKLLIFNLHTLFRKQNNVILDTAYICILFMI